MEQIVNYVKPELIVVAIAPVSYTHLPTTAVAGKRTSTGGTSEKTRQPMLTGKGAERICL